MPIRTIPQNYRNVTGIAGVTKSEQKTKFKSFFGAISPIFLFGYLNEVTELWD